jgi:hypothetical protein
VLKRIGVALLLAAEATAAFSQTTTPPAPAPGEVPAQTQTGSQSPAQEQAPGQAGNAGEAGDAGDAAGQNATSGAQSTAQMPVPLNISSSSLEFAGERTRGSYLQGGLGVTATYDDNLLSLPDATVSGMAYTVAPNVGLGISRPRLSLQMGYEGGYTFNQRFSTYDEGTHNASISLQYRLSPHVNLGIYDHFLLTTGFFDQLQGGVSGLGSGIIQQPNLGVITPFTRRTIESGTVELVYQYSASDTVGVSATGNVSSFGKPPAGSAALVNGQNEEGDAFYSHRITPRHLAGVAYTFQRFTFDPAIESVDAHSVLGFYSFYLNPNTVISVFAGPEYTQLNNQVVSTSLALPYVTVTSVSNSQDRWAASGAPVSGPAGRAKSAMAEACLPPSISPPASEPYGGSLPAPPRSKWAGSTRSAARSVRGLPPTTGPSRVRPACFGSKGSGGISGPVSGTRGSFSNRPRRRPRYRISITIAAG